MSYARGEPGNITTHGEWASNKYQPQNKPKTIVLFNKDETPLAFGKDAKHMLRYLYLTYFKG